MNHLLHPSLLTAVFSVGAASLVWWFRERRLTRLRQRIAAVHALAEPIFAARSATAIQQTLADSLPPLFDDVQPRLWLLSADSSSLEPATGAASPVLLASPAALTLCVRSATPQREDTPNGLRLFFPMRTEAQVTGVFELAWPSRSRRTLPDEHAAFAHLANQAAIALRLADQSLLRDQVLRGERLGAVGQLIAGIAEELQNPIEEIVRLAARFHSTPPTPDQLRSLDHWSSSASQALERLIAFGRPAEAHPRPVDLHEILRKLAHFRERTWNLRQVHTQLDLPPAPLLVHGSYGQLEQALLSVILRAEQLLPPSANRTLRISTAHDASRARVLIEFTPEAPPSDWSLGVAQTIAVSHGGTLRLSASPQALCELDLPLLPTPDPDADSPSSLRESRTLTLLLLAPDPAERHHLLVQLAARNHRIVPASSDTEARDLAARFRFDALLAAVPASDPSWTRLHELTRRHTPSFVLLSEDAAPSLPASDILLLPRPVDDSALGPVLHTIDLRSRPTE